jgi:chromosomal replication initiator protein
MYLAKRVGGWSLTKIGKSYNGRHHTTVCHAIQRIEALRDVNPVVDGLLAVLELGRQFALKPSPTGLI